MAQSLDFTKSLTVSWQCGLHKITIELPLSAFSVIAILSFFFMAHLASLLADMLFGLSECI